MAWCGVVLPAMAVMPVMVMSCGGDDVTVATTASPVTSAASTTVASTTSSSATTSVSSTTSAPSTTVTPSTTAVPSRSVQLLVVDIDGAWLWSENGERELAADPPVAAAIPDRGGGVLFQRPETGAWRPVLEGLPPNTASYRWVGEGPAQPILWAREPAADATVAVNPPSDGKVEIVDLALEGGSPQLAYLRTRYFTRTAPEGTNPWWDSVQAELVVKDLESGDERVVRTQDVGWEYSDRTPTLGPGLVAEVVHEYGGEAERVELLTLDGAPATVPYDPPGCDLMCSFTADLAPTGDEFASATGSIDGSGRSTGVFTVTVINSATGALLREATLSGPENMRIATLDVAGDRALATRVRWITGDGSDRPVLRPGDRGEWVMLLQDQLSAGDTSLAADGIFGPATEAAVRALQESSGLEPTGVVDASTWSALIGGGSGSGVWAEWLNPVVIEPDGTTRTLDVLPAGVVTPIHPNVAGPQMTLWWSPSP
jgi:hypothetical protein